MNTLSYIILFSLVGSVFSLVGGFVLLWQEAFARRISTYLISFAAGTLIGAAFLDLLPESFETLPSTNIALYMVLVGFFTFFLIEQVLFKLHHHETEHSLAHEELASHAPSLGIAPKLLTIGDSLHNFLDGIAITAAFLIDIPLGITTSLVVAAHEIPQEIGDFSIMIHAGWSKSKVVMWNLFAASMTIVGALVTYVFRDSIEPFIGYLLALTAGLFIYIGTVDLLPEITYLPSRKKMLLNITIFFLGLGVVILATTFIEH
ncbi:MAG: ZIP family metal transporter [bacterium]|nr:ZIP family metal transporter [bacterium]